MYITEELKPISESEFGDLFSSFKEEAFRLELLQYFAIPEEQDEIRVFSSGVMKPPPSCNEGWQTLIKSASVRNAKFKRVRMIETPLTLYTKFEIAWGYLDNVPAGEDVRVISKGDAAGFGVYVPALLDYWLFDEKICILMSYDHEGRYLGAYRVPVKYLNGYVKLKNHAMSVSKAIIESPFSDYEMLRP